MIIIIHHAHLLKPLFSVKFHDKTRRLRNQATIFGSNRKCYGKMLVGPKLVFDESLTGFGVNAEDNW